MFCYVEMIGFDLVGSQKTTCTRRRNNETGNIELVFFPSPPCCEGKSWLKNKTQATINLFTCFCQLLALQDCLRMLFLFLIHQRQLGMKIGKEY